MYVVMCGEVWWCVVWCDMVWWGGGCDVMGCGGVGWDVVVVVDGLSSVV